MTVAPHVDEPPRWMLGTFTDDYDNRFTITRDQWLQLPHGRFHIVAWNVPGQYLIARNDSANSAAPGRWTRIDWMEFSGMAPYTWGFCLSAWEAETRAEAESTNVANRTTPRTGCNRFPFSRMKPQE